MSTRFRFVCATRESQDGFFKNTALGRSFAVFNAPYVDLVVFENNTTGLPKLYNEAIRQAAQNPAILIFIHDDIHLCDFFWSHHLINALEVYDIVGLAGNRRRVPNQPSWAFVNGEFKWDEGNLSGVVAHGKHFPPANISSFGLPGKPVKLLDGLLLAARSETLLSQQVGFDERFDFHFYDMDFCRQAEAKNLKLGTATISVIHESGGRLGTPEWRKAYAKYLEKWKS